MNKRILLLLLPLLLTGCLFMNQPEQQTIRLPMGFIPNIQYAPFYVAADKGYFADEGLIVEFDYRFEVDGVALVGAGELPFSLVSGEQVLLARAQGLPVVYAMSWWHDYPVGLVTLADSGIESLSDLAGRSVGVPVLSGASYIGLEALLGSAGLTDDDINLQTIGFTQVESLAAGIVDAVVIYVVNEPVQLAAEGYDIRVFPVADYMSLASNGLLTSEKTIQENPELVRGMVRAFQRGIADTIANPDEAYEISKKYVENLAELDETVQKQVLANSITFWDVPLIGTSDPTAWENMQDTLLAINLIKSPQDLSQAFTNQFIDAP